MITEFEAFEGGFGIFAVLKSRKLVITFDPRTETTYALAIGLCVHERQKFIKELTDFQLTTPFVASGAASWVSVTSQLRARSFLHRKELILAIESENWTALEERHEEHQEP